jgi:hypothetical protein
MARTFNDEAIREMCEATTPKELATAVEGQNETDVARLCGGDSSRAREICRRFGVLAQLHRLEVINKPPRPVIKVMTKGSTPKQISVNQLSDGQKHTILLTIAMLAESNLPLVLDQPEDDLDNAFIFKSVVTTLRSIKERRQVILVTHNANIAVLGDSEMILPMRRSSENGTVFDSGAIDAADTRKAVQQVLEGGEAAFQRRKTIYGY